MSSLQAFRGRYAMRLECLSKVECPLLVRGTRALVQRAGVVNLRLRPASGLARPKPGK